MRSFRVSVLLSVVATYFLIYVGGLVRVAGAGLGCPDWPKCFGRWIPPTSVDQLPAHIDPTLFNFTLAWIEYVNRLVGVAIGILILITAILALKHFRHRRAVLWPSLAAAILVAFQGWLGGAVVVSELEPVMVSAHLVMAIVTVLMLMYALLGSLRYDSTSHESHAMVPPPATRWVGLLGLGMIVQIILGTQLRGRLELLAETMSFLNDLERLAEAGWWQDIHMILGVILALGTIVVALFLVKAADRQAVLVRQLSYLLAGMAAAQLLLGFLFLFAGLQPLAQLFHLWLPTVMMGLLLVLLATVSDFGMAREYVQRSLARPLAWGVVGVTVLLVVGALVVAQADKSRALQEHTQHTVPHTLPCRGLALFVEPDGLA